MEERKHHWPKEYCFYCGSPATKLCDGVDSYPSVNGIQIDTSKEIETCDRLLCDEHAEKIGITTFGGVDTIDYCPKHITKRKLGIKPSLVIG